MSFDDFKSRWSGQVSGYRVYHVDLQLDAVLESQSDSRGGSLPVKRLAARLESLTMEEIAEVTRKIPAAWAVSDEELEVARAFFDFRREPTAVRLRDLAEQNQSG